MGRRRGVPSLVARAMRRQVMAISFVLVIVGFATLFQYEYLNELALVRDGQDIGQHYREEITHLEREWEEEALRQKALLEFSGILKTPAALTERLNSYFGVQNFSGAFDATLVLNPEGRTLYRWGEKVEPSPPGWFFGLAGGEEALYRVYAQPLALGATGVGTLVLYKAIDDALLYKMSFPQSELLLVSEGRVLAVSHRESVSAEVSVVCESTRLFGSVRYHEECVKWDDDSAGSPVLVARVNDRLLLSRFDLALWVALVLVLLVVALWTSFGLWMIKVTRRIVSLSEFARAFMLDFEIPRELERMIEDDGEMKPAAGRDEVGQLAMSLRELARTVKDRNEETTEAIRLRDEFLSMASHELKTPITALSLKIATLRRLAEKGEISNMRPEQFEKLLKPSRHLLLRLTSLIDEFLTVSRIGEGRLEIMREPCDLAAIVQDNIETFRNQLQAAGCEVVAEIRGPVRGSWDSFKIEQVIVNLLTNAMKFGHGRPIEISLGAEGDWAELRVRDHGIGIPTEDQERIFQRFERATSAQSFSGLGLGLYICREIVSAHGGSIRVESEPGKGSEFVVRLPLG